MLSQIFKPIFKSVFSSPFADEALISFELKDGTLKPRASGSSTPTFTRDTIATGYDQFNRQYPVAANQPRQDGYEVVENLITASEDMTNAAYLTSNGGTKVSATVASFDGTNNGQVYQDITIVDNDSGAGGRTFGLSVEIALLTGTPSSDAALEIDIDGDAMGATALSIGNSVSSTPQRFYMSGVTDAAGTQLLPKVRWDDAGTLSITKWQLEEVTGKLSHAPGPYVSSGVGTGVELFTDANAASVTNETDATTGFVAGNSAVLTSETVTDGDSLYSIQADADGNANARWSYDLDAQFSLVDGKTYVLEFRAKHISGDTSKMYLTATPGGTTTEIAAVSAAAYGSYKTVIVSFTHSANTQYLNWKENGANDDAVAQVSTISIKEADHGANIDSVKYFPTLNGKC